MSASATAGAALPQAGLEFDAIAALSALLLDAEAATGTLGGVAEELEGPEAADFFWLFGPDFLPSSSSLSLDSFSGRSRQFLDVFALDFFSSGRLRCLVL